MKEEGFNVRKWLTCNEELAGLIAEREQQSITSPPPADEESFAKTTINSMSTDPISSELEQKVLGLYGIIRMTAFVSNLEVFME